MWVSGYMCGSLMGCDATDAVVIFEFFACFCVSRSEIRMLSGVGGRAFKGCGSNGTRRGLVVCAGGACGRRIDLSVARSVSWNRYGMEALRW